MRDVVMGRPGNRRDELHLGRSPLFASLRGAHHPATADGLGSRMDGEATAMVVHRHDGVVKLAVVSGLVLAACGGGASEDDIATVGGPAPSEMCVAPQVPVLASYDLVSAEHRWHVCGDPEPWYSLEAATEDTVYVGASFYAEPIVIALDTATGVERWRGDLNRMDQELPDDAAQPMSDPPTIDGVALTGGQDDPLVATDASTGAELWRNEDRLVHRPRRSLQRTGHGSGCPGDRRLRDGVQPSQLLDVDVLMMSAHAFPLTTHNLEGRALNVPLPQLSRNSTSDRST